MKTAKLIKHMDDNDNIFCAQQENHYHVSPPIEGYSFIAIQIADTRNALFSRYCEKEVSIIAMDSTGENLLSGYDRFLFDDGEFDGLEFNEILDTLGYEEI